MASAITVEEFVRRGWNNSNSEKTKPFVWFASPIQEKNVWLRDNCEGDWFLVWDTGNRKGRIWFDKNEDAVMFKLVWGT